MRSRWRTSRPERGRRRARTRGQLWTLVGLLIASGICTAVLWPLIAGGSSGIHPAYFVIGDTSTDSTAESRHHIQEMLNKTIAYASSHEGFIAAVAFQDHALSHAAWHAQSFIPDPRFKHNTTGRRGDVEMKVRDFKRRTRNLFGRPRGIMGTDIIGVLLSTNEEFAEFPEATTRSILIGSNMVNVNREDGIVLKRAYSENEIADLVDGLEAAGKIPDMRGACVYVLGGGLVKGQPLPNSVQISLREFWKEYFDRANATVRAWVPMIERTPSCET